VVRAVPADADDLGSLFLDPLFMDDGVPGT